MNERRDQFAPIACESGRVIAAHVDSATRVAIACANPDLSWLYCTLQRVVVTPQKCASSNQPSGAKVEMIIKVDLDPWTTMIDKHW